MNRSLIAVLALTAAGTVTPSCGRTELSGPPSIRLGSDECAGCGMLVSERRCSCAILTTRDGDRSYLLFDDIGCLIDYRADHPGISVVSVFVHDYGTGEWVDAAAARYLINAPHQAATPMGSGTVAFASEDAATVAQKSSGGDIVRFERLDDTRRAWRNARRAHAGGAP